VGLNAKRDARVKTLSGGMQRRLDVALALVGDPTVLFLDEPTTGFDPDARREAWHLVHDLRSLGKTVLLTTHYMDEAQALADRVAVIVDGRIVDEGTPATIGGRATAATTIRFQLDDDAPRPPVEFDARSVGDRGIEIAVEDPVPTLHELTGWAVEHGVTLEGLEVARPSLEDVYLSLAHSQPLDDEGEEK
jgi:ABC-2 type transport system ATP-binding protein